MENQSLEHQEALTALGAMYRSLEAILQEPEAKRRAMGSINWQYVNQAMEDSRRVFRAQYPDFDLVTH